MALDKMIFKVILSMKRLLKDVEWVEDERYVTVAGNTESSINRNIQTQSSTIISQIHFSEV
ncbi:hypothetical protein TRIP_D440164 [uncultured Paludibacter sp.]|nr:hypothetical protein TRIP_D440164 [uncultured Paludibacter sp.]